MNIIAIDPSIRACGIAIIRGKDIEAHTVYPSTEGDLPQRCAALWHRLALWLALGPMKDMKLVIEYPTFQDTPRGRAAAVAGNINTLSMVCGYLCARLVSSVETTELITPQRWKGMESKDVTKLRVLAHPIGKQLAEHRLDHNAFDAAGLALWKLEKRAKFNLKLAKVIYLT